MVAFFSPFNKPKCETPPTPEQLFDCENLYYNGEQFNPGLKVSL